MQGLQKAISILGSQSELARAIKTKQQNVWYWLNVSKEVPPKYAIPIEQATDGEVSRHEICPDIYPTE